MAPLLSRQKTQMSSASLPWRPSSLDEDFSFPFYCFCCVFVFVLFDGFRKVQEYGYTFTLKYDKKVMFISHKHSKQSSLLC